jgi:hypothetical protein
MAAIKYPPALPLLRDMKDFPDDTETPDEVEKRKERARLAGHNKKNRLLSKITLRTCMSF